MNIGVNLPWVDYGKDLENHQAARQDIRSKAAYLHGLGINIIRMFILASGELCQPLPPNLSAPTLDQAYIDGFKNILREIKGIRDTNLHPQLQLIPVFIDHQFCWSAQSAGPNRVKGGRADLIENDNLREPFRENILRKLVNASNDFRDTIYAWELINEPEMCTRGYNAPHPNVSLEKMRQFISEGCGIIAAGGFHATVGFQYFETLKKIGPQQWDIPNLAMTRYQFHYYGGADFDPNTNPTSNDPNPTISGNILPASTWPRNRDCFVGEIPTRHSESIWQRLKFWRSRSVKGDLIDIHDKKYSLVLLWSMNTNQATNDPNSDWPQGEEGIKKYRKALGIT